MFNRDKSHFSIALIILVIFLFNSFAYLFVYFPAKIIVKEISKSSIINNCKNENPVTLVFNYKKLSQNKYDIEWYDDGEEFKYNKCLYDIECKSIAGDSIYIKCYPDEDENILDELFAIFSECTKKNSQNIIINNFIFAGIYYEEISKIKFDFKPNSVKHLVVSDDKLKSFITDIPSPPPRQII